MSLNGRQKAAAVIIALGAEVAGEVFRHLSSDEAEAMAVQIATTKDVPPDIQRLVLREFQQMYEAHQYVVTGGLDYAREVMRRAMSPEQAERVLSRVMESLEDEKPFDFAFHTDPAEIAGFIQSEHPQTIALVLAHLPAETAAAVIACLLPELRSDVAMRIARMGRGSPEAVRAVESVLRRKLSSFVVEQTSTVGGVQSLVDILNHADRSTERTIMDTLRAEDATLAEEIMDQLFVFEDIAALDDRAIQQVLREVDTQQLAMALKGASDEVKNKIFKNMSSRAATMLREDMEFMGPVRLSAVEQAQTQIVQVIRRLEEAGAIEIVRQGEDELVV